ncbi:MAG TPA: YceI family protein [Blastocatellia bacterium]|nr:YceI family protein [Blastocatellia bacterium]
MSGNEQALVRYRLDPGLSTFRVQAFAMGLLAGFGHNPTIGIRDFTGEVQFVPGTLAQASLRFTIKTRSLVVIDEIRERDREEIERTMLQTVLESSVYPEIAFRSTSIIANKAADRRYKVRIIGDLTLHGITRNGIWITAQLTLEGDRLRAQGDFTLRQTDYKIKPVSVAAGTLKLKDELKFSFDLAGHQATTSYPSP